ncbi:hypothetical protein [Dyadobacter sp. 676]|uniref:VRR-NUC domain-containing protein n=1 Tax=Dyadobacter sp. 676 TaxID=3088362 RepID=A0AAU8FS29_9BACT
MAEQAAKYPNVPSYALSGKKHKDNTANALQKAIIACLQFEGHQAERISIEGRVIDTRQRVTDGIGRTRTIGSVTRIKSSAQKGSADVSATVFGRSVKIEVKIGADRQSQAQKDYQRSIESAGGVYLIADSFQTFYEWYLQFRKEVGNE